MGDFHVTVDELKQLCEKRGREVLDDLRKRYGDVNELCRRLKTSPTDGLPQNAEDHQKRRQVFGTNIITLKHNPERPLPKEAVEKWASEKCSVIRGGHPMQILVSDLVVGDLAQVRQGDNVPADGILVEDNGLKVDESSLTGESEHVKKSVDTDPLLMSGVQVTEGNGKMIVTAVGKNSQTGIVIQLLGQLE